MSSNPTDEKEPSHALPMGYYRDPLEQLIAAESTTCKGCAWERVSPAGIRLCGLKRRHGKRCARYVERTP